MQLLFSETVTKLEDRVAQLEAVGGPSTGLASHSHARPAAGGAVKSMNSGRGGATGERPALWAAKTTRTHTVPNAYAPRARIEPGRLRASSYATGPAGRYPSAYRAYHM